MTFKNNFCFFFIYVFFYVVQFIRNSIYDNGVLQSKYIKKNLVIDIWIVFQIYFKIIIIILKHFMVWKPF